MGKEVNARFGLSHEVQPSRLRPVKVSGLEVFLGLLFAKQLANMPSAFHADTRCGTHLRLLDLI